MDQTLADVSYAPNDVLPAAEFCFFFFPPKDSSGKHSETFNEYAEKT